MTMYVNQHLQQQRRPLTRTALFNHIVIINKHLYVIRFPFWFPVVKLSLRKLVVQKQKNHRGITSSALASSTCRQGLSRSPQLALVSGVHGSARFASKVLGEFGRVGDAADDSEPGRAVGVRDDALVGAFRRPHRAPHLRGPRRLSSFSCS